VAALTRRCRRALPKPAHDAAHLRHALAAARRAPGDACQGNGPRKYPHDVRPIRTPRHVRRGRRHGAHGAPREMSPLSEGKNSCKARTRGADRIRTGVRGFAGLCLTSRPPRRAPAIVPAAKVALGRKRLTCAEWTHAASCEPCPGVDGARCGWSPGPLPGLRYGYEEMLNPDYAVPGANRRPARRRAVARVRRSARRLTASSAASSPLRARRRRSKWRSRSYARWLSGFTLTGRASRA
jgi:hypothetical protein